MVHTQLPRQLLLDPAVIVAAHPDDEVLGLGTLLPRFERLQAIVHVTDGAPRRGSDAANANTDSWQQYAALRRQELRAAMNCAGVRARLLCLNIADQDTPFRLPQITWKIAHLLRRFRPAAVFTHPYEGGHPDHDSCAFAVRAAWSLTSDPRTEIFEFASYHSRPGGGLEPERFLGRSPRAWPQTLSTEERQAKANILSRYVSQQPVLSQFPLYREPVRVAPEYDFTRAPHSGKLYYENFDWGVKGEQWRRLARHATRVLEL